MMENAWNKLKTSKGRSWFDAKFLIPKVRREIQPTPEITQNYYVTSETLPEQDREIYGLYLKNDPFFLERCKICSRLFKACVLEFHNSICNKRNGTNVVKKNTFISPNKKKSTKRSNKSTSEDDSESVISSENSSPALDLLEGQVNESSIASIRDDSMIDVISVEEIPSEDSKPPTPGPQDLYEEFTTPFSEEASNSFSSSIESSDSTKFKPALKLKIISNKDANQRSHSTSLLEAHLLSNTKYNTSSGIFNVDPLKNSTFKHAHQTSLLEQAILKGEDVADQSDGSKSSSSKLKTDTKVSIPISMLPQTVKITGSLKKQNTVSKNMLSKTNLQKLVDSKEKTDSLQSSSPFGVIAENGNSVELSSAEFSKVKAPARSKRNKRSKGKNRSSKNTDFDPDKHCGVLVDENKRCLRSLTCKTHSISLRRAVEGRSKEFDRLLAEHRASKEALKDQDRIQTMNLAEPVISIPILAVDKISGNTIQIPACNSSPEIVRVRVANLTSTSENQKLLTESDLQKGSESEKVIFKKLGTTSKLSTALNSKPSSPAVHRSLPNGNSQSGANIQNEGIKLQLYNNDLKISFVCSDMLYKVGGLLYTDRSRQAIRKCMMPLTSNGALNKTTLSRSSQPRRKITDFLQLVKNTSSPPIKLSLLKEQNGDDSSSGYEIDNKFKSSEEIERMRNLLTTSGKVLSTLSTDESELRKLRLTRLKRSAEKGRLNNGKRVKLESITDENYDINTLLSFDKSLLNKTDNDVAQFPMVSSDGYVCSFRTTSNTLGKGDVKFINQPQSSGTIPMSYNVVPSESGIGVGIGSTNENVVSYQENDTTQLWQTFQDLESEIRNTVGASNIQELYATQSISNDNETYQTGYVDAGFLVNNTVYQENGENDIEETISKNYSLLEEYCKNITTDELLSDGKGNYDYYESSVSQIGDSEVKLNKNVANVINEHMYTNVGNSTSDVGNSISVPTDGLNFDAQVLTSYLTSVGGDNRTTAQNINVNDINFGAGDQFSVVHLDAPIQGQTLTQEHVYEEILTLNKQFQDSTAVKK